MVMLDTLPRNDTGKVVKAELVEPATGENGSAVRS
jgi:hypothetical protein